MERTRILIRPDFKEIPKSDAANVQENIERWLHKGMVEMILIFCRKDPRYKTGYRFIRIEDLDETIITQQKIKGIDFEVIWFRRLHTINTRFYPLYFSEWFIDITLKHKDFSFVFKSDNDLMNKIKQIKENKNERDITK